MRKFRSIKVSLIGIMCLLAFEAFAACPGWTSWTPVQYIYIANGGNYYIQPDSSLGAGVDPCGCKHTNGALQYLKVENPATDSTKGQMALTMLAKARDKRIQAYITQCYNNTPGSGYGIFSYILTE